MSHTNETPNFDLPQFTADDKPDWLVDINAAFLAIDTGMEATQSEAESASSTAQLAQETAENAAETAGQASSDVAGLTTDLETLQGTVNTVTALIGNGTPTTTDKTIIGAINELAAIVEAGDVSVTADGVKTNAQLLGELFSAMDMTKVSPRTILEITTSGVKAYANLLNTDGSTFATFSYCQNNAYNGSVIQYVVSATASNRGVTIANDGTVTNTDGSSTAPANGTTIKVIY